MSSISLKCAARYVAALLLVLVCPLLVDGQQGRPAKRAEAARLARQSEAAYARGDIATATSLLKKAIPAYAAALEPNDARVDDARVTLAGWLREQGQFQEAEAILREAFAHELHVLPVSDRRLLKAANEMVLLLTEKGERDQAKGFLERALALREKTVGLTPLEDATLMNTVGVYNFQTGNHAEAEAAYRRALGLLDKQPDVYKEQQNVDTAITSITGNLATLLSTERKFPEAQRLASSALRHYERLYGPEHPQLTNTLGTLGEIYKGQRRFTEAKQLLERSLRLSERGYGASHEFTDAAMARLAELCWVRKDTTCAMDWFRKLDVVNERVIEARAYGSEDGRFASVYAHSGTSFLLSYLNGFPSDEGRALAFDKVLRQKGRVLTGLRDEVRIIRRSMGAEGKRLLAEQMVVRRNLVRLQSDTVDPTRTAAHRREVSDARSEDDLLTERLGRLSAPYRRLLERPTLRALQTKIPERAALLEYVDYGVFDPDLPWSVSLGRRRYGVFVVRRTGPVQWIDLGDEKQTTGLLEECLAVMRTRTPAEDSRGLAQRLYATLIEPVTPFLSGVDTLYIAPDAGLHLAPWGALESRRGVRLRSQFQVSLVNAGREVLRFGESSAAGGAVVIVANPTFDVAAPNGRVEAQRQGACITENWQSLPDTADEARTVQRLMTGTVFEGPAATKAALLGVRRPHILHVATHAFLTDPACALPSPYARDSPLLRSGLALAGANRPGSPESSLLMAAEAATLDLEGTALVTLSACGSGRGAVARDEGILGLRRSLTIAGAQSQLVSLWKVDGPATARFMGEFYARLAAGKGRARALRESQEALATTPAFAAPFFWAAFALIGDPGPIVRRAR